MSTQLRRIEGLLGEGVFLRSSAGVELTAYGAQVVGRAREILALSDNLARLRPPRSSGATRRLRLGAINTPVVPTLLDVLREACPDLTVSVSSVYATGELIDLLEAGELDVALGCDYPGLPLRHSPKLDHRAIRTVPVFVATPADHPLAHRLEVSLADLSEDAWFVSADDGVGWPGAFYDACGAAGFRPAVTHEFHMLDQLQSMIAKGLGWPPSSPPCARWAEYWLNPSRGIRCGSGICSSGGGIRSRRRPSRWCTIMPYAPTGNCCRRLRTSRNG